MFTARALHVPAGSGRTAPAYPSAQQKQSPRAALSGVSQKGASKRASVAVRAADPKKHGENPIEQAIHSAQDAAENVSHKARASRTRAAECNIASRCATSTAVSRVSCHRAAHLVQWSVFSANNRPLRALDDAPKVSSAWLHKLVMVFALRSLNAR